jgi:hypothetical protein
MRLHKIWLPDMDSPPFIAQARRASLAANRSPSAKEDQDFVDSISILPLLPQVAHGIFGVGGHAKIISGFRCQFQNLFRHQVCRILTKGMAALQQAITNPADPEPG